MEIMLYKKYIAIQSEQNKNIYFNHVKNYIYENK